MPARKKRVKRQIVEKEIDLPIPALYNQRHLSTIHVKEILFVSYDPSTCKMDIGLRSGECLRWTSVPQKMRDRFTNALGHESFAEADYWNRVYALPDPPEPKDHSKRWEEILKGKMK